MVEIIHKCAVCKFKNRKMFLMLCAVCPAKVFFQIYNIYLDNNLNDYLMLDLRCLGTGNDLLLFSTSCPARRRPAWRLLAGAGQVKEVSQRIDQCSCYLLPTFMFMFIIILLMHYVLMY